MPAQYLCVVVELLVIRRVGQVDLCLAMTGMDCGIHTTVVITKEMAEDRSQTDRYELVVLFLSRLSCSFLTLSHFILTIFSPEKSFLDPIAVYDEESLSSHPHLSHLFLHLSHKNLRIGQPSIKEWRGYR
jgi:hypothetical protein